MMNNIKYISEETKQSDFRKAMEEERRYTRQCNKRDAITNKVCGVAMLGLGVAFWFIGGEGIMGTIICAFIGLVALFGKADEE